jgi:BRCA1-associated protein
MRGYHINIRLQSSPESKTSSTSFIPASLFQHLPAHKAKLTARRNSLFNPAHQDYRFGLIRLDWVDFEDMSKAAYNTNIGPSGKEKEQKGRGKLCDLSNHFVRSIYSTGPATATFVPHTRTKYGSTNLPEGTVHVFRDSAAQPAPPTEEIEASNALTSDQGIDSDGVMLGILAVPSWMNPSDFLAFVAPAADSMAHLRIIR